MKVVHVALVLALTACTHYELRHGNRIGTASAVGLTACDWGQTAWAVRQPQYDESNGLLGDHPSELRVAAYMTGIIATTIVADREMPDWAVPIVYTVVSAVAIDAIWHNSTQRVPIACGIEGAPVR